MEWKKLQNGSDIRGVAMEGVENEPVNLTSDVVKCLGQAFAIWLKNHNPTKKQLQISVGMDPRLSGPEMERYFTSGVLTQGIDVYDFGIASTPAIFMSTKIGSIRMDGGVMITASHLPFNRNGLKFFTEESGLDKKDITEILKIAEEANFPKCYPRGVYYKRDFMAEYSNYLVNLIRYRVDYTQNFDNPLEGIKIVVDAGNGSGGFFAENVLKVLGADVSDSQFLIPDGLFPNHPPNPEDDSAMVSIVTKVKESNADLGIIFDTDVDRAGLVFNDGTPINRNTLIALISAIILEENPKSTIVTDSITSNGLSHFINEHLKGKHHRFKRGYKNVINEAIRLNETGENCCLAIETSGHAAFKENYFLDDGAYLVAKILIKMAQLKHQGKTLTSLISELKSPVESREIRITVNNPDFKQYGEIIIADLAKFVENQKDWEIVPDNHEGIRVNCNAHNQNGWFLLRLSLHDPVMPLNIESDVKGGVENILNQLILFLRGYDELKIC
ncbi:MAG: phosphoglucomutase [Marinilabiliaceae bacterium]|nr:phosphoglucomutase [Marinilabiliaceae bacterium]